MKHEGYTITKDEDGTYGASVGDKVIVVGLHSSDDAKKAIDARRERRKRLNLDPVG